MRIEDRAIRTGQFTVEGEGIIRNDTFLQSLPQIDGFSPVTGGVAHKVFQVASGDRRFYLKIRGDRFESIPEITCNPADIAIEQKALTMFHEIAPDNFPQVLSFNEALHYLVLSDAIPNGEKMEDMFLEGKITPDILCRFGRTLSQIHTSTATHIEPVRPNGDATYYQTVLGHRLGYRQNPILTEAIQALSGLKDKQLILGDVSPKNIGVNDDGRKFIFFDLETAHQGDAVFDYAFFLGHVLIHSSGSSDIASANITAYTQGYEQHGFDNTLVKRVALGIVLYRLRSVIPYPTGLDPDQTTTLEKRAESLLLYDLDKLTWKEISDLLFYEEN